MALTDPPAVVGVPPETRAARRFTLGIVSVGCVAVMVVATVAGSLLAGTLLGVAALPLAILALALSAAAVILGLLAAVRGPGRILGIAGLVAGVALNPALLAVVLGGAR